MKTSVAAVFLVVVAISVLVQAGNVIQVVRECKREAECTENILQIMRNNGEPETRECYCALGCLGKKTEILTDANGVDKEKVKFLLAKMKIPEDDAESIAEQCATESAESECEAAEALIKCIKSE